jgi:hypothetical protein
VTEESSVLKHAPMDEYINRLEMSNEVNAQYLGRYALDLRVSGLFMLYLLVRKVVYKNEYVYHI